MGEALNGSDAVDKNYVDSRAPLSQLEQGAKGYWGLDGDYKDSINGYDGTPSGTSFSNTAIIGQALEFTASSDEVNVGRGLAFDTGDFSVSIWVYPKNSISGRSRIISIDKAYNPNRWSLNYESNEFRLFTNDGSNTSFSTPANYPVNHWYHVVVTRTGSSGEIWVNGQVTQGAVASGSYSAPGDNSLIGGDQGGNNGSLDGIVDEVASFDRVLTENEIKYLYHEGKGTNDFVSYDYTMNYDIDMKQNQILNLGSAQTTDVNISDDAVQTLSPPNDLGVAMFQSVTDVIIVFYDVYNGATQFISQFGSLFNDAGGTDLTGSTGVDGKINVSSNGGEIHIENRSGASNIVRSLVLF